MELTQQVRNYEDQIALQELIDKHQGIFYTIVHKYSSVFKHSGVYKPDILDDRDYIIYKTDSQAKHLFTQVPESGVEEKVKFYISEVKKLKDERAFKIFKLRYLNGSRKLMPWNQIGKKLKLSTQTALNIHNKAIKTIKRKKFV